MHEMSYFHGPSTITNSNVYLLLVGFQELGVIRSWFLTTMEFPHVSFIIFTYSLIFL